MRTLILFFLMVISQSVNAQDNTTMNKKVDKTDAEWKEILSPQQYTVLREKGTDRPGDGGYTKHFEKGTYHCAACDANFSSRVLNMNPIVAGRLLMMPLRAR